MPVLVNVDGRLVPPGEAFVPVLDRGFLYGDSVYEVVRTYRGKVFELGRHLDRMDRSAAGIALQLPSREQIERELSRTLQASANAESYARIVVTRGEGAKFGLQPHFAEGPGRLIVIVRPLEPPPPDVYERGLRVAIAVTRRNPPQALDPALKTGNYLNSILALRDAHAAGADDALLLDLRGQVTEGSSSNVFFVQGGIVVTPPLQLGMLHGITRALVIDIARGEGLIVREEPHGAEALAAADEVFVTSTVREVLAVTSLVLLRESDALTGEPRRSGSAGASGAAAPSCAGADAAESEPLGGANRGGSAPPGARDAVGSAPVGGADTGGDLRGRSAHRAAHDVRVVADGMPGPITRRLHQAFRRYVEQTHER
jgi:branched-chain amino acid aminotransferase